MKKVLLLTLLFSLSCISCATKLTYVDPSYGKWIYEEAENADGSLTTRNLKYKSPNGNVVKGLYVTTGFFSTSAIVETCGQFNNSGTCTDSKFGIMKVDGTIAENFGEYYFPELATYSGIPSRGVPRNLNFASDVKSFPLWKNVIYSNNNKVVASGFSNNMIMIKKNELYGFMNYDGKVVIPPSFIMASTFEKGIAYVVTEDGQYGKLDLNGNLTFNNYACQELRSKEGYSLVSARGHIVNNKLEQRLVDTPVTMYVSTRMNNSAAQNPNVACMGTEGSWGLINASGELIIPMEFQSITPVQDGYIVKKLDGKTGFFRPNGNVSVSAIYDDVMTGHSGIILKNDQKYAVCRSTNCDKNSGFIYDNIIANTAETSSKYISYLNCQFVIGQKGNKFGVVSLKTGLETVDFVYDEIMSLKHTEAYDLMLTKKNGLLGIIYNGFEIYPPSFTTIGEFDNDNKALARDKSGNETFVFMTHDDEQNYKMKTTRPPMPPMPPMSPEQLTELQKKLTPEQLAELQKQLPPQPQAEQPKK